MWFRLRPVHLAAELEFFYLNLAERHRSGDELALERAGMVLDHLADWLSLWQQ
ncbi:MAG: hypothetical protein RRB13_05290 [bacterium]|nr:hypothetical protein [bacterium]